MRRILIALSACVTILSSCQKEVSFDLGNSGNGNSSGSLLTKLVSTDGTDSVVNNYSYNSSGKLIAIISSGVDSTGTFYSNQNIIRNSKSIIQQIVTKSSYYSQYGIDSVITNVHYNSSSSQYTSYVTNINYLGMILRDSVAFTYDGNGKVITETDYSDGGIGSYSISGKDDLGYTGNNLTSIKSSSYNSGTYTLDYSETVQYDSKTSPLILGNESLVISLFDWYSPNNPAQLTTTNTGSSPQTVSYSYTYNTNNKPVSSKIIQAGTTAGTISY